MLPIIPFRYKSKFMYSPTPQFNKVRKDAKTILPHLYPFTSASHPLAQPPKVKHNNYTNLEAEAVRQCHWSKHAVIFNINFRLHHRKFVRAAIFYHNPRSLVLRVARMTTIKITIHAVVKGQDTTKKQQIKYVCMLLYACTLS